MTMRIPFPDSGTPWEQLDAEMDARARADVPERLGGLTMYSLKGSDEVQAVARAAWSKHFSRNALFSLAMPSLFEMEVEVCGMVLDLLGGAENSKASLTSGGTESILGALHAAREWARQHRPTVQHPKVLAPQTAHAAFSKGCHYLGIELVRIPCRDDWRADVDAIASAIDGDTIAVVGSAPQWPHGRYDDIAALGALARERDLWCHVDACFGGMLAPFVRDLGHDIPLFDLSVAGVSSISVDLHKYGYAAKPASIVAYRTEELHRFMPHWVSDWPSGTYMTDALLGSRPGGAVAAAWAVMRFLGRDGYRTLAERTMTVKRRLADGIDRIEGLNAWPSELSILTYEGVDVTTTAVSAAMSSRGWFVMGTQEPPLVHLTVDPIDDEWIEHYLSDLADAVVDARSGRFGDGQLRYT